ncbi:hypothetical protein DQ04_00651030 [Trypanosoma grayi]|uniref:hypothetical protein n=1 Tax=Trypanosoma grayi TaxID=71804 RepID=UPI0004F4A329|nr:hypothetical protein DQ04_00651030 [Trypanosoma grayi]KEG14049.1 hypothetical protein DQ04_00651030 [Trypanosoma grayi]
MSVTAAVPKLPSIGMRGANKQLASRQDSQQHSPATEQKTQATFTVSLDDTSPLAEEALDVLTCSEEDFQQCLDTIKESIQHEYVTYPKKRRAKGYTKQQTAKMHAELLVQQQALAQASEKLHVMLESLEQRLDALRHDEAVLHEYYNTLDELIERGEDVLRKKNQYHRWHRELRRDGPRQRYASERMFLEHRQERLQALLREAEEEECDIAPNEAEDGALGRNYRMANVDGGKMEEVYEDATSGSSPEARLRMRALRPLLQKVQETRIVPPLPPWGVSSRLRKELILPFSARVLALKMDEGNNAGDRFVEWYINTVIDPLAMAQLVELVPREYLVTTTVRLAKACDTYVHLRQAQSLPDVSHVVLQAVAEGRPDAVASLVLSPSGSFLRALESKEHTGIIFFAALITGQVEVLRRLMSVGFYNINALLVWLFLNPNTADPFYVKYVTQLMSTVRRVLQNEVQLVQDLLSDTRRSSLEDDFVETTHIALETMNSDWNADLLTHSMCEKLRRFLQDCYSLKKQGAPLHGEVDAPSTDATAVPSLTPPSVAMTTSTHAKVQGPPSTLSSTPEASFSFLLGRKKLDRLQLSAMKCAVLPAVSTSVMRRVGTCGYTPLQPTTAHLLLVGDTSTVNAHVVRLPPQYTTMWSDEDPTENTHARRQRERREASQSSSKGLSFYYEAHISLKFLLSDVPAGANAFATLPSSSWCRMEDMPPPLQTSSVFVGWCSEEHVAAADGHSMLPPLGSDCHSLGISFDVLHRSRIGASTEEIILRPMRHTMGRATPFMSVDSESCDQDAERSVTDRSVLLLRVLNEDSGLLSGGDLGQFSSGPFSSPVHASMPSVYSSSFRVSSTSEASETAPTVSVGRETVVPTARLIRRTMESSEMDFLGSGSSHGNDAFASVPVVLTDVPVYSSLALVVGCQVDFASRRASFTVNGTSLGTAFTALPSPVELRPAVSLQASKGITTLLQRENPADAVIIRFVFAKDLLLAHHLAMQDGLQFEEMFSMGRTKTPTPATMLTTASKEVSDGEGEGDEEERKKSSGDLIPGVLPITHPLLFDESMTQCALIRLLTCAEATLPGDGEDDEILRNEKETLVLGSALRVTALSVRQLLNTTSSSESLLFFPSVLVKRRSDDEDKQSNGVTIIPEDAPLVPLCAALALRQRIPAYNIAQHPFTDFSSTDESSIRQRRMSVLAAATLGYEEVLYILLERISVYELIAMFTLKHTNNETENAAPVVKGTRVFSTTSCRTVNNATMLHRVEYTPLHCALLEGHQECVHLLLYYLNHTLSEEYRRHAVNVMTRSGETALLIACRHGYTRIAKRLLAMGASPSSFDRMKRANCLELACASRSEEIARMLLETPDYRSQLLVNHAGVASPLCWCALNNIGSLIRPLLESGANPNVTLDGPTPLLLAVTFGSVDAALQLLECCDAAVSSLSSDASSRNVSNQSRVTETASDVSYDASAKRTLAVLDIDALDPRSQCSALHIACELGQLEVVLSLIAKGASLNLQSKLTYANPLQMVIMNGHENLALEVLEYAKDKLRRGFNVLDIAAIDKNADTALHHAAREGMLPVIEYIMLQFSDEEITRLCGIRKFARRPNAMSVVATNRMGRTPLLVAVHARQEAAAQLIASLMPEYLPNPGGPVIDGTCVALLTSDSEGLEGLTLFLLSHPRYIATDAFRENFFSRYNSKRLRMDQREDGTVNVEEDERRRVGFQDAKEDKKRQRKKSRVAAGARRERQRQGTHVTATLIARASITAMCSAGGKSAANEPQGTALSRRRSSQRSRSPRSARQRRRSTFVQMLLAKGGSGPSTHKAIEFLERGFSLQELYAMVDTISSETSRTSQSMTAMRYADTITSFLFEYGDVRVASSDAVIFARKLRVAPTLVKGVDNTQLADAKAKLLEMRTLCRELFSIVRTRGHRSECVEDMRHMIVERGLVGAALTEEVTSPFGYTLLQLAASLGLPHVCAFLLGECEMDPLYVPPPHHGVHTASKWLVTPFRLAVRSINVETVSVFLSVEPPSGGVQVLLEHRELLEADDMRQTVLQELVCMDFDTLAPEVGMDALHVLRLLLRHGAVVQGNYDAGGNDAWLLVVRASPGKGTKLQVFFDEQMDLGDEGDDDDDDDDDSLTDEDDTNAGHKDKGLSSTAVATAKTGRPQSIESASTAVPYASEVGSILPLKMAMIGNGGGGSSGRDGVGNPRMRRNTYYAELLFLCAEHNPQSLVSLLDHYPGVLSPSFIHPLTGDTLLLFLLRRAANIYAAECGAEALLTCETGREDVVQTAQRLISEADPTQTACGESSSYRDPFTIPNVRCLLLVVEQLLRKFHFSNMYFIHNDGQTALAVAACMSYTTLIALIVSPGTRSPSMGTPTEKPNRSTEHISMEFGTQSSLTYTSSDAHIINVELRQNLVNLNCWMILATRLYYAEEDMETVLTIVRHLPDTETRLSFLSMVYSNLHPIVALRVAVLYANDVKRILMQPEAVNAFWCNVLYTQYVGRLDEVAVTPAQWNSLLSVLLPTASAVPIYLIKAASSFLASTSVDTLLPSSTSSLIPAASATLKERTASVRSSNNWKSILKRTEQYTRQLVAAAVYVAAPASAISTSHGGGIGGVIPNSQRHVLTAMAAHFYEIIELSVRFDNASLLANLMDTAPEELRTCVKHVWRNLMEEHQLEVIAIAAGSVSVLKLFSELPETSAYIFTGRYNRIDAVTGLTEGVAVMENAGVEVQHQGSRNSMSTMSIQPGRSGAAELLSHSSTPRRIGDRTVNASPEPKPNSKRIKERRHTTVNLLSFAVSENGTDASKAQADDGTGEAGLQYMDVMTAARERTTASAVMWGIGAAARPVALQDGSKTSDYTPVPPQQSSSVGEVKKISSVILVDSVGMRSPHPVSREGGRSLMSGSRKTPMPMSGSEVARGPSRTSHRATTRDGAGELPRYFAYYLCDWALHTTLMLRAPHPSSKAIDTLLHLMDGRSPLTASAVQVFLAASRPLNHWESSDGRVLTISYVTRTHRDTILHLLVQNDQLRLARYFLAAALCYFTCYQYDPPSTMPPQFSTVDLPNTQKQDKALHMENTAANEEKDVAEDDETHPAVFLRSMLRLNKYGLTPFDYARGPMVSLLMEYGCVPPSYRPNPQGFCRALRLETGPAVFQSVPRLLLVSANFIVLRDEAGGKPTKRQLESRSKDIPDTALIRSQTFSQHATRTIFLPMLLTDDVSLLHLGLCSADDELVLQQINDKRQQQIRSIQVTPTPRASPMPPTPSSTLHSQRQRNMNKSWNSTSKNATLTEALGTRRRSDKELPTALKLLDLLRERGFIAFPLLLPITDEMGFPTDDAANKDGTAILVSLTPMALAGLTGAVKRADGSPSPSPTKRRSSSPAVRRGRNSVTNDQLPTLSRFTATAEKERQSAEALEAWTTARRGAKPTAPGKIQNMNVLLKALTSGAIGRAIRSLSLITAPSYEKRMCV